MGTTLTGTTPQDTYDSLIKVTNNGPLSSTARYLSDGLGNDSALALSTSKVGIGTATPNSKLDIVQTSDAEAFRIDGAGSGFALVVNGGTSYKTTMRNASIGNSYGGTAAPSNGIIVEGNVGIGTSSPASKLDINQTNQAGANDFIRLTTAATSGSLSLGVYPSSGNSFSFIGSNTIYSSGGITRLNSGAGGSLIALNTSEAIFYISSGAANPVERARFTANGLTFNGDTAAANALDDYEEGTWTPAINFGGASVGVTYNFRSGIYQKIGNKVTLNCFISVSNKGTSTGDLVVSGFPFALLGATANYCPITLRPSGISFADQIIGYAEETSTQCFIQEISSAGSVTGINDANCNTSFSIMMQITYFA